MVRPTSTLAVVVVLALACMVGPSSSVRLSGDGGGFRIADDDGDMEPLGAQAAPERRGRVVLPAAASLMRFSERRQEAPAGKGKAGGKGKGASGAGSESEAPRAGAGVESAAPVSAAASAAAARDTADATADAAVATATAATAVATTKARKLLTNAEMRAHFDALKSSTSGASLLGRIAERFTLNPKEPADKFIKLLQKLFASLGQAQETGAYSANKIARMCNESEASSRVKASTYADKISEFKTSYERSQLRAKKSRAELQLKVQVETALRSALASPDFGKKGAAASTASKGALEGLLQRFQEHVDAVEQHGRTAGKGAPPPALRMSGGELKQLLSVPASANADKAALSTFLEQGSHGRGASASSTRSAQRTLSAAYAAGQTDAAGLGGAAPVVASGGMRADSAKMDRLYTVLDSLKSTLRGTVTPSLDDADETQGQTKALAESEALDKRRRLQAELDDVMPEISRLRSDAQDADNDAMGHKASMADYDGLVLSENKFLFDLVQSCDKKARHHTLETQARREQQQNVLTAMQMVHANLKALKIFLGSPAGGDPEGVDRVSDPAADSNGGFKGGMPVDAQAAHVGGAKGATGGKGGKAKVGADARFATRRAAAARASASMSDGAALNEGDTDDAEEEAKDKAVSIVKDVLGGGVVSPSAVTVKNGDVNATQVAIEKVAKKDKHGCMTDLGFAWCPTTLKCFRTYGAEASSCPDAPVIIESKSGAKVVVQGEKEAFIAADPLDKEDEDTKKEEQQEEVNEAKLQRDREARRKVQVDKRKAAVALAEKESAEDSKAEKVALQRTQDAAKDDVKAEKAAGTTARAEKDAALAVAGALADAALAGNITTAANTLIAENTAKLAKIKGQLADRVRKDESKSLTEEDSLVELRNATNEAAKAEGALTAVAGVKQKRFDDQKELAVAAEDRYKKATAEVDDLRKKEQPALLIQRALAIASEEKVDALKRKLDMEEAEKANNFAIAGAKYSTEARVKKDALFNDAKTKATRRVTKEIKSRDALEKERDYLVSQIAGAKEHLTAATRDQNAAAAALQAKEDADREAKRKAEEARDVAQAAKDKAMLMRAAEKAAMMERLAKRAPIPEQPPLILQPCGLYATCAECTEDEHCGWMPGEVSKCMGGDKQGPFYWEGGDNIPGWNYGHCDSGGCAQYTDCAQCLSAPGCGFCGEQLRCAEGTLDGPLAIDACPVPDMLSWLYKERNVAMRRGRDACPLRQHIMSEHAQAQDFARRRTHMIAKELQKGEQKLRALEGNYNRLVFHLPKGVTRTPETTKAGEDVKMQRLTVRKAQISRAQSVGDVKAAESGESRSFEMGYQMGLKKAEKENIEREAYMKGLTLGLKKAEKMTGPPGAPGVDGQRGAAGVRGERGSDGDKGEQGELSRIDGAEQARKLVEKLESKLKEEKTKKASEEKSKADLDAEKAAKMAEEADKKMLEMEKKGDKRASEAREKRDKILALQDAAKAKSKLAAADQFFSRGDKVEVKGPEAPKFSLATVTCVDDDRPGARRDEPLYCIQYEKVYGEFTLAGYDAADYKKTADVEAGIKRAIRLVSQGSLPRGAYNHRSGDKSGSKKIGFCADDRAAEPPALNLAGFGKPGTPQESAAACGQECSGRPKCTAWSFGANVAAGTCRLYFLQGDAGEVKESMKKSFSNTPVGNATLLAARAPAKAQRTKSGEVFNVGDGFPNTASQDADFAGCHVKNEKVDTLKAADISIISVANRVLPASESLRRRRLLSKSGTQAKNVVVTYAVKPGDSPTAGFIHNNLALACKEKEASLKLFVKDAGLDAATGLEMTCDPEWRRTGVEAKDVQARDANKDSAKACDDAKETEEERKKQMEKAMEEASKAKAKAEEEQKMCGKPTRSNAKCLEEAAKKMERAKGRMAVIEEDRKEDKIGDKIADAEDAVVAAKGRPQRAAAVAKLAGAEKEAKTVAKDAAAANPGAETATEVEAVKEAAKEDKAHVRSEVAEGAVGRAKTPAAKAKAKALAAEVGKEESAIAGKQVDNAEDNLLAIKSKLCLNKPGATSAQRAAKWWPKGGVVGAATAGTVTKWGGKTATMEWKDFLAWAKVEGWPEDKAAAFKAEERFAKAWAQTLRDVGGAAMDGAKVTVEDVVKSKDGFLKVLYRVECAGRDQLTKVTAALWGAEGAGAPAHCDAGGLTDKFVAAAKALTKPSAWPLPAALKVTLQCSADAAKRAFAEEIATGDTLKCKGADAALAKAAAVVAEAKGAKQASEETRAVGGAADAVAEAKAAAEAATTPLAKAKAAAALVKATQEQGDKAMNGANDAKAKVEAAKKAAAACSDPACKAAALKALADAEKREAAAVKLTENVKLQREADEEMAAAKKARDACSTPECVADADAELAKAKEGADAAAKLVADAGKNNAVRPAGAGPGAIDDIRKKLEELQAQSAGADDKAGAQIAKLQGQIKNMTAALAKLSTSSSTTVIMGGPQGPAKGEAASGGDDFDGLPPGVKRLREDENKIEGDGDATVAHANSTSGWSGTRSVDELSPDQAFRAASLSVPSEEQALSEDAGAIELREKIANEHMKLLKLNSARKIKAETMALTCGKFRNITTGLIAKNQECLSTAKSKMEASKATQTTEEGATRAKDYQVQMLRTYGATQNTLAQENKKLDAISIKDEGNRKKQKVKVEFAALESDKIKVSLQLAEASYGDANLENEKSKITIDAAVANDTACTKRQGELKESAGILKNGCEMAKQISSLAEVNARKQESIFSALEKSLTDNDDNQRRKRNAGVIAMSYALSLRRGAFMDLGHAGYLRARAEGNVSLTVECWVRLRELPGPADTVGIVSALGGDGGANEGVERSSGFFLGATNGSFVFGVRTDGEAANGTMTMVKGPAKGKKLVPFQWYHVAGTFDANQIRLYIQGKLAGYSSVPHGKVAYDRMRVDGTTDQYDGARLLVGSLRGTPGQGFIDGIVDDVAIWGRKLAEQEVKNHATLRMQTKNQTMVAARSADTTPRSKNGIIDYIPFGPGELPGFEAEDKVATFGGVAPAARIRRPVNAVVKWVEEPPANANLAAGNIMKTRLLKRRLGPTSCDMVEVRQEAPDANMYGKLTLHAKNDTAGNSDWRTLVKFGDILFGESPSQIPAVGAIRKATLRIMTTGAAPKEMLPIKWRVYLVTEDFDPKNVTWNNMPEYTNHTWKAVTLRDPKGWQELDVTTQVRTIARNRGTGNYSLLISSESPATRGQTWWAPNVPSKMASNRPELVVDISDTARKPIQLLGQPDKGFTDSQQMCVGEGMHLCSVAELKYASEVAGFTHCTCGWTSSLKQSVTAAGDDPHAIAYVVAPGNKPLGCEGVEGVNYCGWQKHASAFCCAGQRNGGIPAGYKGDKGVKGFSKVAVGGDSDGGGGTMASFLEGVTSFLRRR